MSFKKVFPHLSADLKADPSANFKGDVYIDGNTQIGKNVIINGMKYRIKIGENCIIKDNVLIEANSTKIIIGNNVEIGENCKIFKSIESNRKISSGTTIVL